MDTETWRAMLVRRGYTRVRIWQEGCLLKWSIAQVGEGEREAETFARLSYRGLRQEIDTELGHGMLHVMHICGHPLLKAPRGYVGNYLMDRREAPLLHAQYFTVPLCADSVSLLLCPQCSQVLLEKDIHHVKDFGIPEEHL
jgi:hypothetical protein